MPGSNPNGHDEETTPLVKEASTTATAADAKETIGGTTPVLNGFKVYKAMSKCCGCKSTPSTSDSGSSTIEEDAWSYFEKIRLPRRVPVSTTADGKVRYRKADPGTPGSVLYPAWTTKIEDLSDFGTGIAVYFMTLRATAIMCFIAGLMYIPSLVYYGSDEYGASDGSYADNFLLQSSMLCPAAEWVPCPTCTPEEWFDNMDRIATIVSRDEDGTVTGSSALYFVLQTTCAPLRWQEGANHLLVVVFLFLGLLWLGHYQKNMELKADEDILSASDYSIQIDNPPQMSEQTGPLTYDPKDPKVWRDFFQQFGHVVYITIALNNHDLCLALAKRRSLLQKLGYSNPHANDGIAADGDESAVYVGAGSGGRAKFVLPSADSRTARKHPEAYKQLVELTEECKVLVQKSYEISAVFVTFDKESAQRAALKALLVGQVYVNSNDTSVLAPEHVFQESMVLDVMEANEPSAIRWQDLDETMLIKLKERSLSFILTVMIIGAGFWFVELSFEYSVQRAAIVITLLNIIVPHIFKAVNMLESHQTEGSYQASLYTKICVFRWINTAIVTLLIKPSTATLTNSTQGLITAIYTILKAELMIAPIVHVLDIGHNIRRHLVSRLVGKSAANPDSLTHSSMIYMHFTGSKQNLGEKYTNLTKTLFIAFLYSVIFPAGYFLAAAALYMTYVTDKFLLVRSWGPMAEVSDQVAHISRRFFLPLCLVTLCLTSQFFWSSYPFDDVCDADAIVSAPGTPGYPNGSASGYLGTHDVLPLSVYNAGTEGLYNENDFTQITVEQGTELKQFCDQDYLHHMTEFLDTFRSGDGKHEDDWMSRSQLIFAHIFGLSSVVVFFGFIIWRASLDVRPWMNELLYGGFSTDEVDSGESYCDQTKISAYVPSIVSKEFLYPLLACDVRDMDTKHIGWVDPFRSHDFYNMAHDVDALRSAAASEQSGSDVTTAEDTEPVLSVISYFPSNTKKTT